jgi:endo-1,4-beta-xylanase
MTALTVRRRAVLGGTLLAALSPNAARSLAAAEQSLRAAAAAVGLRYGANCDVGIATTPQAYQALFAEQCALLAPNFNWVMASPAPDDLDLSRLEPTLGWVRQHGLALTGMHLLWYLTQPKWFTSAFDRGWAQRQMISHTSKLAARLAGQVYAWNVVNEDIDPHGGGVRPEGFIARFGVAAVAQAFQAAQRADPAALRVLNDYDIEGAELEAKRKRHALLATLDELLRAGAPVQAVGVQSHLRVGMAFNEAAFARFLDEIAARGLRIVISEFDVLDVAAPGAIAPRDQAVADLYARYLAVALAQPATVAVVTWGLSDRYTWLVPLSSQSFARRDALSGRPLPFAAEFRPKPAYFAMLRAFEQAPRRDPRAFHTQTALP